MFRTPDHTTVCGSHSWDRFPIPSLLRTGLLTLGLALVAIAWASPVHAQSLTWETDLDVAKSKAGPEERLILLHFETPWSQPCRELHTFVFPDRRVQHAIRTTVIPVRVNADEAAELVKEYSVEEVPFDVVLLPSGRIVSRRRSPREADGYVAMMSKLEDVLEQYLSGNQAAMHQNLDEIKSRLQAESDSFADTRDRLTPDKPEYMVARPSSNSSSLKRHALQRGMYRPENVPGTDPPRPPAGNEMVNNPFFANQSARSSADGQVPSAHGNTVRPTPREATRRTFSDDQPQESAAAPAPTPRPLTVNNPFFQPVTDPAQPPKDTPANMAQGSPIPPVNSAQQADFLPPEPPRFERVGRLSRVGERELEPAGNQDQAWPTADQQKTTARPATAEAPAATWPKPATSPMSRDLSEPSELRFATASPESSEPAPVEVVSQPAQPSDDTDDGQAALQGHCPVTLVTESRWATGDPRIGYVHQNQVYLFASPQCRQQFTEDPDRYSPLLAGFDPVIFHESGQRVPGKVEHGVFMGQAESQQVVLFASAQTRDQFQQAPNQFLEAARSAMQSDLPERQR